MTTLAVVFMVWAIIATAFLVTERERGMSCRRLWLDERTTRRRFQRFAKEERLLRLYWETRAVSADVDVAAFRALWVKLAAEKLKAEAERNGHRLEVVKDDA